MTARQPDLFADAAAAMPPGATIGADLITQSEEKLLIAAIDASGLAPFAFQGWQGKRLTASFGHGYDFARGALVDAPPMPEWLLPFRVRLAEWARLPPDEFVQALLIRYDPGAGIGWHRDRPQFGAVLGLSLGNATTLRFRQRLEGRRFDRCCVQLFPRAGYLLEGPARWEWEHSILPVTQPRWSITFRTMRR